MKRIYLTFAVVALILSSSFIAFSQSSTPGFQCDKQSFEFNITNKLPKQMIHRCEIQQPITTDYYVYEDTYDPINKVYNYSFQLNFGGKCVQGMGIEREVSYNREGDQCKVLKEDMSSVFDGKFNNQTLRKEGRGRFGGKL